MPPPHQFKLFFFPWSKIQHLWCILTVRNTRMSRNVSKTVSGIFFCCPRSYLVRAHWFLRGALSYQEGGAFSVQRLTKRGVKRRHYLWQSGVAEHQRKRGCCRGINCSRGVVKHRIARRMLQGYLLRDVAGAPSLKRCCRCPAIGVLQSYQLCRDVAGAPTNNVLSFLSHKEGMGQKSS